MYARARHALACGVLASCVAVGAGAVAGTAAAAPAAVPAASCTVTPAANGMSVVITGEGFSAPRDLNDGESTERLNVDANGNFRLQRFQKNVDYTVLAVNEDQNFTFVNCKVVGADPGTDTGTGTTTPGTQRDYRQGHRDGYRAGIKAAVADCDKPPQPDTSQTHTDMYRKGWTAAAQSAFDMRCKSSPTG
ncbi:hypothetical protein [Streptomyces sp. NPDC048606]|uniref:hypothetical protein n=1 Tax=Streptomyces sp. NPDC048606 TaxID=3154726 RepID=UPI0034289907